MSVLKFIHENIYVITILIIGVFLRFDRLGELMPFIGDQGLFYLPARDMILHGNIPLVGPETSHPWIHHGAHWTYLLAIILWIFEFNPVAPAYFIALLGTVTVLLFYIALNSMFDKKIAILGSILYATSPLIVINSRIPYHTSPIPFFVILLFFLTFKLIKGSAWIFPVITFLLGVLYNHEITTFVFFIAVGTVLGSGFIRKEVWFKKLIDRKIISASIIAFIVPMIPFILYDISHGWRQTLGFLVWVVYRIIKFPLSLIDKSFVSAGSNPSTLGEFFSYYKQLIFAQSSTVALIILIATILFISWYLISVMGIRKGLIKLKRKIPLSYILLFLFLSVSLIGLSIHRVPIEADTLLIAPFIIILTIITINWVLRGNFVASLVFVLIISTFNIIFLLSTTFLTKDSAGGRITFLERLKAVEKVAILTRSKPYNIVGKGALSNFRAFTLPYEYLLWWKGNPPESKSAPLKIVIWEKGNEVIVYEEK